MISAGDVFKSFPRNSEAKTRRHFNRWIVRDRAFPASIIAVWNYFLYEETERDPDRIVHFTRLRVNIGNDALIVGLITKERGRRFYWIKRPRPTSMVEFVLRMGDDLYRRDPLD